MEEIISGYDKYEKAAQQNSKYWKHQPGDNFIQVLSKPFTETYEYNGKENLATKCKALVIKVANGLDETEINKEYEEVTLPRAAADLIVESVRTGKIKNEFPMSVGVRITLNNQGERNTYTAGLFRLEPKAPQTHIPGTDVEYPQPEGNMPF